jgi:DNA primase large subunit
MNDQPGPQDNHGCPFRHFDLDNLNLALSTHYRLTSPQDIADIQGLIKADKYHVACTRVFELTHASKGVKKGEGIGSGESVSHPNQYTARSRELEREQYGEVSAPDSMEVDA